MNIRLPPGITSSLGGGGNYYTGSEVSPKGEVPRSLDQFLNGSHIEIRPCVTFGNDMGVRINQYTRTRDNVTIIGEPSSNFCLVYCVHFWKGMNPTYLSSRVYLTLSERRVKMNLCLSVGWSKWLILDQNVDQMFDCWSKAWLIKKFECWSKWLIFDQNVWLLNRKFDY